MLTATEKKDPWQMTQRQVRLQFIPPANVTFKSQRGNFAVHFGEGTEYFQTYVQAARVLDKEHLRSIKWALKEGKPVPTEVLGDYPSMRIAQ